MNENQIRNFLMVAEKGNITAAAANLFISPQALHQQLNLLEKELGTKLLNRHKNGVSLTCAGEIFLKHGGDSLRALDRMRQEIRELQKREENHVVVGHNGCIHEFMLFTAWAEFRKLHPEISMNMRIKNLQEAEYIDTILSDVPDMPEFDRESVMYSSPFFIVLHKNNPLSGRKSLLLEDLEGHTLILPDPELMKQLQLPIWRELQERKERIRLEGGRSTEAESLVNLHDDSRKLMLSWGPRIDLTMELRQIPIEGFQSNVSFFYRSKGTKPAAKIYIDFMCQYYQAHWQEKLAEFLGS